MTNITADSFYSFATEALIVTLLLVTIGFFFGQKLKKTVSYKPYIISRRLMGIIMLLYLIMNVLQQLFHYRDTAPHIASLLNLICYYAGANLCYYAFSGLLNPQLFHNYRSIRFDSIKYAVFFSVLVMSSLFLPDKGLTVILWVAAVFFAADVIRMVILLFRTYRQAVKNINDFYSDFIEYYVQWIYKSTVLVIVCGIAGSFITFLNKWWIGCYSLFGVGVFFYIFICYTNYLMHIKDIDVTFNNTEDINAADKSVTARTNDIQTTLPHIDQKIQKWIQKKGFLQSSLTIIELSTQLRTNRTYLSTYIHNTYHCSFCDFICQLRLEHSKQLLSDRNNSITEIAEQTGFSSVSSFSRAFTKHEKCSPSAWRSRNT